MRNSAIILAALLMATPTLAVAEARSEIDVQFCQTDLNDQDEHPPVKAEFPQSKKQWLPLKQCKKTTIVKYADTTHCFLRIDGKIIINRMCHVNISQQLRAWEMEVADVWRADVWMKYRYCYNVSEELRDSFYAIFEKRGRSLNYGRVEMVDERQEHICWGKNGSVCAFRSRT